MTRKSLETVVIERLAQNLRSMLPELELDRFIAGTHTQRFADNLLPSFRQDQVRLLRQQVLDGAGGELRPTRTNKRPGHAPHSSTALAANAFGGWIGHEPELRVNGLQGFASLRLERKIDIPDAGTPNLDVWLEGEDIVVGVESKLTEHLSEHKYTRWDGKYETSAIRDLLDEQWQQVLGYSLEGSWRPRFLGLQQLIKHALALSALATEKDRHLVYCYWTPEAEGALPPELQRHAEEVGRLRDELEAGADPAFHAIAYPDLFQTWSQDGGPAWLKEHVALLKERYRVTL